MLASLAFLPQHLIEEGFFVVMAVSPDEQFPALIEFNNYFVSQWMENHVMGLSWSCAGESHRTKNFFESWHHRVNGHFNTANPNFCSVLSFYRDEERLAFVKRLSRV